MKYPEHRILNITVALVKTPYFRIPKIEKGMNQNQLGFLNKLWRNVYT